VRNSTAVARIITTFLATPEVGCFGIPDDADAPADPTPHTV